MFIHLYKLYVICVYTTSSPVTLWKVFVLFFELGPIRKSDLSPRCSKGMQMACLKCEVCTTRYLQSIFDAGSHWEKLSKTMFFFATLHAHKHVNHHSTWNVPKIYFIDSSTSFRFQPCFFTEDFPHGLLVHMHLPTFNSLRLKETAKRSIAFEGDRFLQVHSSPKPVMNYWSMYVIYIYICELWNSTPQMEIS